ncbi:isoamylase early set domain-containing protein [Desulfovibrio sp. OttesenSCG-928-M14]|nr:isoamylase early set domain-containing protein [Desulfovibrio sp. OttesenSCG-928-M16]MDL2216320.1 isoamylase early set domain-containing protein [Desulfovibrio sp. OttesenSCG-928-M14]
MAISKSFLKSRPACKVKFKLSPEEANQAQEVFLVGDFNNWSDTSHPMKKLKDGSFSLEIELPLGQDCQFRYRTGDNEWLNDSEADGYMPCAFAGAENSLVKV